ncbi:unnamed protein product [Prorocentrum cordatum]|uniref:Coronin n=1 Tax=Prorocentrum cordatum TaxID=2364126 RepID=A0ABN9VV38_9DINO|nr:unnamed protein product [Polarella glacialis]
MGARLCGAGGGRGAGYAAAEGGAAGAAAGSPGAPLRLEAPSDDVVPCVCPLGGERFAAGGTEGWSGGVPLRLDPRGPEAGFAATPGSGAAADAVATPALAFQGHGMSVSALDTLGEESAPEALLFTGSRDCSVRLWDLATGGQIFQHKLLAGRPARLSGVRGQLGGCGQIPGVGEILRNVVTAVRRLPAAGAAAVVQASEDLQLRLWDVRGGLRPAAAVPAGPNQVICLDVSDDGNLVACGTKGFSRENCEVKLFDLRGGLRQLASQPCADQAIEALRVVGPDRCLVASKDGFLRGVSLPEALVVGERGPAAAGYTALGTQRRAVGGPVALAALAAPGGVTLELLAWKDATLGAPPELLASAG